MILTSIYPSPDSANEIIVSRGREKPCRKLLTQQGESMMQPLLEEQKDFPLLTEIIPADEIHLFDKKKLSLKPFAGFLDLLHNSKIKTKAKLNTEFMKLCDLAQNINLDQDSPKASLDLALSRLDDIVEGLDIDVRGASLKKLSFEAVDKFVIKVLTDKRLQEKLIASGFELKPLKQYTKQRLRSFFQLKNKHERSSHNLYFAIANFIRNGGDALIDQYFNSSSFNKSSFKKKFANDEEREILVLLANFALLSKKNIDFVKNFIQGSAEKDLMKNVSAKELTRIRNEKKLYAAILLCEKRPERAQQLFKQYVDEIKTTSQMFLAAEFGLKDKHSIDYFREVMNSKFDNEELFLTINIDEVERRHSRMWIYLNNHPRDADYDSDNNKIFDFPLGPRLWWNKEKYSDEEEEEIFSSIECTGVYEKYGEYRKGHDTLQIKSSYFFEALTSLAEDEGSRLDGYKSQKLNAYLEEIKKLDVAKLEKAYFIYKEIDLKHHQTHHLPFIYSRDELREDLMHDLEMTVLDSSNFYKTEFVTRLFEIQESEKARTIMSKILASCDHSNQLSLLAEGLEELGTYGLVKDLFIERVNDEDFALDINQMQKNELVDFIELNSYIPYALVSSETVNGNSSSKVIFQKNLANNKKEDIAQISIDQNNGQLKIEKLGAQYVSVNGEEITDVASLSYGSYIALADDLYRLEFGEERGALKMTLINKANASKIDEMFMGCDVDNTLETGLNIGKKHLNRYVFHKLLSNIEFHEDMKGDDVLIFHGDMDPFAYGRTRNYLISDSFGPSKANKIHFGLTGYSYDAEGKPISAANYSGESRGLSLIKLLLNSMQKLSNNKFRSFELDFDSSKVNHEILSVNHGKILQASRFNSQVTPRLVDNLEEVSVNSQLLFKQAQAESLDSRNDKKVKSLLCDSINSASSIQEILKPINFWTELLYNPLSDLEQSLDLDLLSEKIINNVLEYKCNDIEFQVSAHSYSNGDAGFAKVNPRSWNVPDLIELGDICRELGLDEAGSRLNSIHMDFYKMQDLADEANKLDPQIPFGSDSLPDTLFHDETMFYDFLTMLNTVAEPLLRSESKYNLNSLYPAIYASKLLDKENASGEREVLIQNKIKQQIEKQFLNAGPYYQCEFLSRLKFFNASEGKVNKLIQESFESINKSDALFKVIDEYRFQGFADNELKLVLKNLMKTQKDFDWYLSEQDKNNFYASLNTVGETIKLSLSRPQINESIDGKGLREFHLSKIVNDRELPLGSLIYDSKAKHLVYDSEKLADELNLRINGQELVTSKQDLNFEDILQLGQDTFYIAKTNDNTLALHQISHQNSDLNNQLWIVDGETHFKQSKIGQCMISALFAALREDPSGAGMKLLYDSLNPIYDCDGDLLLSTRLENNQFMQQIDSRYHDYDKHYPWQKRISIEKSLRGYGIEYENNKPNNISVSSGFIMPENSVDIRYTYKLSDPLKKIYEDSTGIREPSFGNRGVGMLGQLARELGGDEYQYLIHSSVVIQTFWESNAQQNMNGEYVTPGQVGEELFTLEEIQQQFLDVLEKSGKEGFVTMLFIHEETLPKSLQGESSPFIEDHGMVLGKTDANKTLLINPWNTKDYRSMEDQDKLLKLISNGADFLQWDISRFIDYDIVFEN